MNIHELRPCFSSAEIADRVRILAGQINAHYAGKPHDEAPLVMLCVLKGAFIFFSDLLRQVTVGPEIDFLRVASYGATMSSSAIRLTKDVEISLQDKHVLLVEDIVDTGHTVHFLLELLRERGPRSLALAALIDKRERRETDVVVDFPGFVSSGGFLVGYGLDYAERYRELPDIRIAVPEKKE